LKEEIRVEVPREVLETIRLQLRKN
jgi:hypothetical protein